LGGGFYFPSLDSDEKAISFYGGKGRVGILTIKRRREKKKGRGNEENSSWASNLYPKKKKKGGPFSPPPKKNFSSHLRKGGKERVDGYLPIAKKEMTGAWGRRKVAIPSTGKGKGGGKRGRGVIILPSRGKDRSLFGHYLTAKKKRRRGNQLQVL